MKDFISIEKAAEILKNEGIVAIPTETVYGLAGKIDSKKALKNIFEIKNRPFFDPLIVHVSHLDMIKDYVIDPSPLLIQLAKHFWPGPLTIVFNKNPQTVSDLITSGMPTVAIRQPKHPITQTLIQEVGVPLAAPSANPFKKTSPTEASHVRSYFADLPIIDGGPCDVGLESTIIKLNGDRLEILRPGQISKATLEEFLKKQNLNIHVYENFDAEGPGSMEEHYQPMAPLYLFKNQKIDLNKPELKNKKIKVIEMHSDPRIFARLLYKTLIDNSKDADALVLECHFDSNNDQWSAIYNRLKKAAKVIF